MKHPLVLLPFTWSTLGDPFEHGPYSIHIPGKNEGAVAEQFIGQHLQDLPARSSSRELTYWLREGIATNAEVDYVDACEPIAARHQSTGCLTPE